MAFKILSAHPACVQIPTDSINSKLKNYLSAVSTKHECKIRIVGILHLTGGRVLQALCIYLLDCLDAKPLQCTVASQVCYSYLLGQQKSNSK